MNHVLQTIRTYLIHHTNFLHPLKLWYQLLHNLHMVRLSRVLCKIQLQSLCLLYLGTNLPYPLKLIHAISHMRDFNRFEPLVAGNESIREVYTEKLLHYLQFVEYNFLPVIGGF